MHFVKDMVWLHGLAVTMFASLLCRRLARLLLPLKEPWFHRQVHRHMPWGQLWPSAWHCLQRLLEILRDPETCHQGKGRRVREVPGYVRA